MSRFHESIREILEGVYVFLHVSLQEEPLSSSSIEIKESLKHKISEINEVYPQLQLNIFASSDPMKPFHHHSVSSSTDPPPPYIDMHGNCGKKDVHMHEESYELCASEKEVNNDTDHYHSGDGRLSEERQYPVIAATNTSEFEKCGYLEKKGKERLGGLFKPCQQRWYAMKDCILYYYDKPTDKAQKGALSLKGYEARLVLLKDKRTQFSFELVCPGKRSYQFTSTSFAEIEQWVAAVEQANRRNNSNMKTISSGIPGNKGCELQNMEEVIESDDIYEMVEENVDAPLTGSNQSVANRNSSTIEDPSALDHHNLYCAGWDCQSVNADELDFHIGDKIQILSKEFDADSWWVGKLDNKIGLVPKSYLMEVGVLTKQ